MLGAEGMTSATKHAILNANYIKKRLEPHYDVLYTRPNGAVAHEMIFDLRKFKPSGVEELDVAKRLMDYGFHAPTVSFPVAGTLMIEPTESESQEELDRFCDAMIAIRHEIQDVVDGRADRKDNVLKNAPHTAAATAADAWTHPYTREQAAFPASVRQGGQVLASGRPHRQRTRRSQSDLHVSRCGGVRGAGLAVRVLNAAQMRDADRQTIEEIGIPSLVLMENAGRQVVAAIEAAYDDLADKRVAVLCGQATTAATASSSRGRCLQRGGRRLGVRHRDAWRTSRATRA